MKIAVIGSGISGLTTAYELSAEHEVHLFEGSSQLGLGGRGYETEINGTNVKFDIPPRVFNRSYYKELYSYFKVNAVETFEIKQMPTFFDHNKDAFLSFSTFNLGTLSLSYPSFNHNSLSWMRSHAAELLKWHFFLMNSGYKKYQPSTTLISLLNNLGYKKSFIETYLYPVWSLMCTCPYEYLDNFPAIDMCELFRTFTSTTPTLRLKGGTKAVEEKLSKGIQHIHLNTRIDNLRPLDDQILLHLNGAEATFDKVVVATEPQSAVKILDDAFYQNEINLISKIPVFDTTMILHTDQSLMPKTQWSGVNLQTHDGNSSAIIWMKQIEDKEIQENIFQSWDPVIPPKEDSILSTRTFQRSLCTPKSIDYMKALREKMASSKNENTYFAGTYLFEGIPLLENGIKSAKLIKSLISNSCN